MPFRYERVFCPRPWVLRVVFVRDPASAGGPAARPRGDQRLGAVGRRLKGPSLRSLGPALANRTPSQRKDRMCRSIPRIRTSATRRVAGRRDHAAFNLRTGDVKRSGLVRPGPRPPAGRRRGGKGVEQTGGRGRSGRKGHLVARIAELGSGPVTFVSRIRPRPCLVTWASNKNYYRSDDRGDTLTTDQRRPSRAI